VFAAKTTLVAASLASGIIVGWLADGRAAAIAGVAVLLAAANGYSKSYSP
jgi:hypothetical protein